MQEPILSYANGRGVKNMYSSEPDPVSGKCTRKWKGTVFDVFT